ncbi:MAG: hypothetical protein KatS3mg003_1168 [Candidatus Nitrosocaldaceae archaeon]|nr:MAG: hypothetical protein KatS3mg003_1168 [Candidatus Nitrosocaldaceae archaeon]
MKVMKSERLEELRKQERVLARLIKNWYYNDEFRFVVIYGTGGVGKSSYAIQSLKQVDKNYRECIVFKPSEFIDKIRWLREHNKRIPALIWDDIGVWMYNLDFNDPFVKSAVKFFNVARTVVGAIIGTTISLRMLVSNLRAMDMLTIKCVYKRDDKSVSLAKGYVSSMQANLMRLVKLTFEDLYPRFMEDDDYEWYRDIRKRYADEALAKMLKSIN